MRRLLIAGNWKMNLDLRGAIQLASGLKRELADETEADLAVFPPAPFLADVCDTLENSSIDVGGQNLYPEPKGAFTGEMSGPMLVSVGCTMVLVGHSERRDIFGESDDFLNAKLKAALEAGLRPILCCGEHVEQRQAGNHETVVAEQITRCLAGLSADDMAKITIAYEPVWAIGTGLTATPEQANAMHATIRELLGTLLSPAVADATRILYGGSVKPANAKALMAESEIDGGLVGGASLSVDDFVQIVRA
jgi:triosephosphate isomerase